MPTRRTFLAAASTAALAGCTNLPFGGSDDPPTPNPPSGPVATVTLPDAPGDFTYEQMGSADAPAVTYYGNWKCPFCAEFATGEGDRSMYDLPTIVADHVEPGNVRLEYRSLAYGPNGDPFLGPDAPRAARAGIALWHLEPESYWPYHETVMQNQPNEGREWATTDQLVDFAIIAGVEATDEFRSAIESGEYEQEVKATTEAASQAGVPGTPTLVYDGETASPFEPEKAKALFDRASQG
jgi:protein-disulfide isomerase